MKRVAPALPWLALLVVLVFPFLADVPDQSYYIGFARRVMIFAIAAASLNFIAGFGGMVSLGHAAFFGAGAYTIGVLARDGIVSAWLAWPAATLVATTAAFIIGAISLRTRGVYFIMITLAFAQMVYFVAVGLRQYGGQDGFTIAHPSTVGFGIDLTHDLTFYYVVVALLVGVLAALNRILDARFGRVLVGIRENEARMEAIGFPVYRYKLAAFSLSGAVAGLAGALYANHNLFVSPAALHWTQSATLILMVVVGGIGFRFGGVLGAATLLVLEELLALYTAYWHLPLGVLLLAVVFLAPHGLAGSFARSR